MKELGDYLRKTRENNGVNVEEVAEDLNISENIIFNIENGNNRAFRDMLELKEYVKVYSKYLGLDSEQVIDEFNDFLFEHTSKIKLSDILEAEKQQSSKNNKVVYSPYTKANSPHINIKYCKIGFIILAILLFLIILIIVLRSILVPDDTIINELMIKYKLGGEIYECS